MGVYDLIRKNYDPTSQSKRVGRHWSEVGDQKLKEKSVYDAIRQNFNPALKQNEISATGKYPFFG